MVGILDLTVEKIFDLGMKGGEPLAGLRVREVDRHICTRGDDVEFGIEDIDTMNNPVESRHGECSVSLILANCIFASCDLLEGTGDDEICVIHGYKIRCELA